MIGYSVNDAKSYFDPGPAQKAEEKATTKALFKMGAFIRRAARSSIKNPRKRKISDLDSDELEDYQTRVRIAERTGEPKPDLGTASSKPGEPPRNQTGYIKKFIFFVVEKTKRTVVVGPAKLNRPSINALEALERGGNSTDAGGKPVNIEARPFMGPAEERERDKFAALYENSL